VRTGVDVDALIASSRWLEGLLGRRLEGSLYRAAPWPSAATSRDYADGDLTTMLALVSDTVPEPRVRSAPRKGV